MNAELRLLNEERARRRQEEAAHDPAPEPPPPPPPVPAPHGPQRLGGDTESNGASDGSGDGDSLRALNQLRQKRKRDEASPTTTTPEGDLLTSGQPASTPDHDRPAARVLRFQNTGPGIDALEDGRAVTKTCNSQAYALSNALRAGRTSATFRLDFVPDGVSNLGVFPADMALDGTCTDETKTCKLLIGSGLGGWAQVVCAGEDSPHTHKALHWTLQEMVTVDMDFEVAKPVAKRCAAAASESDVSEPLQQAPAVVRIEQVETRSNRTPCLPTPPLHHFPCLILLTPHLLPRPLLAEEHQPAVWHGPRDRVQPKAVRRRLLL